MQNISKQTFQAASIIHLLSIVLGYQQAHIAISNKDYCDLDPTDLKINVVHVLATDNISTNFDKNRSKHSPVIDRQGFRVQGHCDLDH